MPKANIYLLCKIATTVENNPPNDGCFRFKSHKFMKLGNYDFETLFHDINANRDFNLKIVESDDKSNSKNLYITYTRRSSQKMQWNSRIRILSLCFNNINELLLKETNLQANKLSVAKSFYITSQLYEMLREAHNSEKVISKAPDCVQHELLKPKLRPYQIKAVQWLLHRETNNEKIPHVYDALHCTELQDEEFFLNCVDLDILDYNPGDIFFPSGGILADEMGLGKTVEMLALILLNGRSIVKEEPEESHPNHIKKRKKRDNSSIFCVCSKKRGGKLVTCTECGALQHEKCVRKYAKDSELDYLCPNCWEGKDIVKSGATIIVSPQPIKMQWQSEIKKHINAPIAILLYEGISQMEWISPKELAEYDIVLTDYTTLTKEIHFSTSNKSKSNLRSPKLYMRVASPLTMVHWWRVCLDEAQMVENSARKNALMVKTLPAVHRWAVTGTPIQKSIDDLRGLLEFLDIIPFCEKSTFGSLVSMFQEGETKPLLDVLQKIMWRTCKSIVLDELGIPPQSEEVHYVFLSDVEKLFYQSQHLECATAFEEKAMRIASQSTLFSKMDPRTLKLLLDPLRKIRQDCTVPVVFQKSDQSLVKKLLQPQELLEHLKSTNELECKSQLRTIASCYNGMAALHFIKGEVSDAIKLYDAVLRRAKDYSGAVSVDSLLQIHALHNLVIAKEANGETNVEDLEEYKEQCIKLEWKYIEMYYNNLQKAEHSHSSFYKAVADAQRLIKPQNHGNWWRNIIYGIELNGCEEQLLSRINEEKKSTYLLSLYQDFTALYGVDYFLTIWFDKILQSREEVLNKFEHFKKFKDNIKPPNELSEENKKKINCFVKNIFQCHLNNINTKNKKEKKETPPKTKNLCILCKAKRALSNYECLIFDKILDERNDVTEGSWKPTLQETIMKIIFHFARAKNISEEDVREGENYLHLIDCMKKEYKELGKVWIETEYTVKAYDELNMCKLRLQAIPAEKMKEKEDKSIYIISEEQVGAYFMELSAQLQTAEMEFVRKSARLKYIQHLESNSDPGICPICNQKPDSKYIVLECGHYLCIECLAAIKKYHRNTLTCSVCRNQQKYENIYFVTCKPTSSTSDEVEVRGHYSSKIEKVVRTVLELRRKERDVKILIFSHWEAVLGLIGNALKENDVSFRLRSFSNSKAIPEFKDDKLGVTCLLLLLAHGSKGLNLIEATHVFIVEPILNPGEEEQAIGRVHRIGQTKPTTVHRFICKDTIEEQIFNTVSKDKTKKWELNDITIDNIRVLFSTNDK